MQVHRETPTEADRGPDQLMLRTLVKGFPQKTAGSAVDLEKVIEFSTVVCDAVRQCQSKQAMVPRGGDERCSGLVGSKISDIVRETWLCLDVRSFAVAGWSVHPALLYTPSSIPVRRVGQKPQDPARIAQPKFISQEWIQSAARLRIDTRGTSSEARTDASGRQHAMFKLPWVCDDEYLEKDDCHVGHIAQLPWLCFKQK